MNNEKIKERINEIIKENEKTLLLYLKEPVCDRFIEGKLEAYKNCLQLIDVYGVT